MKSTGMSRKVDELGRVVIPIEIRRTLGIAEKDELSISVDGNTLVLAKVENNCTFCGSDKDLFEFKGKNICKKCASEL